GAGHGRSARGLEPPDTLDVEDVLDLANGLENGLELLEVLHLDHEMIDALAVVGDGDVRLGDIAVAGRDRGGDLGQEAGPVALDVHRDAHRPGGGSLPSHSTATMRSLSSTFL